MGINLQCLKVISWKSTVLNGNDFISLKIPAQKKTKTHIALGNFPCSQISTTSKYDLGKFQNYNKIYWLILKYMRRTAFEQRPVK